MSRLPLLSFVCLVCLACGVLRSSARAEDESVRERVVRAVRDRDLVRAATLLEEIADDPKKRAISDYTDGAEAALDLLPPELGNALAARLAERGLAVGTASNPRVWAAATKVRRRLIEDVDADIGEHFLRVVMSLYRNESVPIGFRYELADLLRSAGRQADALVEYEALARDHPLESKAALNVEQIREDRGDLAGALRSLRDFLTRAGSDASARDELSVRLNLVKVLLHARRDFDAATDELAAARTALERLPRGAEREGFAAAFVAEENSLAYRKDHAQRVRALIGRIDLILGVTALVSLVVLGGGVLTLRRLRWM